MPFAAWVRDRLWRANSWSGELAQLRQALATERRSATTIERIFDVASATEYCDPDRGRALTLYLEAFRGGHEGARARAKHLAGALGAQLTLAEIAMAEGDALAAGTAYLDAGFRELAVEPLERFTKTRPGGASPTTENVRLEGVPALLSLARGHRFDAEREIADTLTRARHTTGRATATAYLHAARIARIANLGDRLATILAAATHACPNDDAIAALVATRLFENANTTDELLAHFGARLELTTSRAEYVERARAAGVELIARNHQPGLGLRLVRMSLEHAYAALLPDVTSHIAAWELLWAHAQAQHSTPDLMPLLDQALAAPLSENDALYLSRLALEITWRDAADPVAARPYAAMVLDFSPNHPLAVAFVREAAPDMEAPAEAAPPEAPAATLPVTTPAKGTPRISMPEGQVKRVASAAPVKPHGVTGRMALLKPPPQPPREPVRPKPPTPGFQARAERKVVPVDVVIELPGGGFFSTVLRDLSASGAFIVTKRQLEVGTIVTLELRIPVPGALTQSSHRTNARIARRTDLGCGLAFIDTSPELVAAILKTIA